MPDAAARHGPALPDEGPDAGRPGASDPIAELVARLRGIGLDPDAEELCDALWLARWACPADPVRPAGSGQDAPERPARSAAWGVRPGEPLPGGDRVLDRPRTDPPGPLPYEEGSDQRIALYPVPRHGGLRGRGQGRTAALPVGVPVAPAFPKPLELQRALRPLQGYRSAAPPRRTVLDETATAEKSARAGGLVLPVFRAVTRADAQLQLVMDASSSMRVWDRMFAELEQVFGRLGAFWDIQVSHLHEGPDGRPAVSHSPEPRAAPLHSADRLSDPTGRRITLVVSDCAGPLWHSGHAHRLLHQLARQAPAAVLQPLPQRMWSRTRLPVTYGELTRGESLGGAAALRIRTPAGRPP
ncbi:MAG: hypothetical protein LBV78_13820, partial [Kitasatospora sp.]|nr:hypothetical protein [Kitasatospora sp.]